MDYLLKSSALFLLMYLGYTLFLKKETFFNHNRWFLLAGIITATILPLIQIPVYIPVEIAAKSDIPLQFQYIPTEVIAEENFDWKQLASYLYIVGVVTFLIQFLLQFGSLVILLVKNAKNKEGIYTYVIVKSKISPFSFFKWIVYNPNLFSNEELQLILNHEKVHVRQWHSVDIIISRLACILFWFNPICWFYHKTIQQNLEYIADDKTQQISSSKKNYQELLLKTSIGNTNINLTSNFYNSLIKKRIIMLQKNRSKSISRWKSALVIPFFILFLMSFNKKEVYVEKPSKEKDNISVKINTIEIYFTAQTTEKDLEDFSKKLKAEGVKMTINDKVRNTDNLLTTLNLSFEHQGSSANYSANDTNGIKPFYFRKKDNGSIAVGPLEIIEVVEEPEIIEIIEEENEENPEIKKEENTFIIKTNPVQIEGDSIYIIESSPKTKTKYSFYTKDTVVIGKPHTISKIKAKGNVRVTSNDYTIKTDSINYKNVIKVRNTEGTDPIYIINGKRVTKKQLKKLNPESIKEFNVIKGEPATTLYGKSAKDGAIVIGTGKKKPWAYNVEVSKIEYIPNSTKEEAEIFIKSAKKPLIIVNGETLGNIDIKGLDPDVIGEINVIKGDKAIEMYGNKAKNGALIIFTKDKVKNQKNLNNKNTEITAIGYFDESQPEEKTVLYFISKMTTKSMIEKHINQLKSNGIIAKVSKVKRNSKGEIIKIKIALKDNNGSNSSATFENKNGIPTINFGKQGGNLVVSSKKL